DAPLLVSEYAPAGAGHAARPAGFARMHAEIAGAGPRVLGSAPYTWTAAGPEAVDAYFGLVDADGRPVDGTLAEIARFYGVALPLLDGMTRWSAVEPSAGDTARSFLATVLKRDLSNLGN